MWRVVTAWLVRSWTELCASIRGAHIMRLESCNVRAIVLWALGTGESSRRGPELPAEADPDQVLEALSSADHVLDEIYEAIPGPEWSDPPRLEVLEVGWLPGFNDIRVTPGAVRAAMERLRVFSASLAHLFKFFEATARYSPGSQHVPRLLAKAEFDDMPAWVHALINKRIAQMDLDVTDILHGGRLCWLIRWIR